MPCWEINLISVELKVDNIDYLEEALTSLGINYQKVGDMIYFNKDGITFTINTRRNKIEMDDPRGQRIVNEIKRAYSKVVLNKVAKRNKWSVRTTKNSHRYQLVRY